MKHYLLLFTLIVFVCFANAQTIPVFTPDKKENVKSKVIASTKKVVTPLKKRKKTITNGYVENYEWKTENYGYSKYFGIIENGIPNGKGKFIASDGVVLYEGDFLNGQRSGYGIEKDINNNEIYKGSFLNDDRNGDGSGRLYCRDCKFIGFFRNGTFTSGKILFNDGSTYNGERNIFTGNSDGVNFKGKIIFNNGDIYEGGFKNQKQNGWGMYLWKDGTKYIGEFYEGDMKGKGTLTWDKTKYFTGTFKRVDLYRMNFDEEHTKKHSTFSNNGKPIYPIQTLVYISGL